MTNSILTYVTTCKGRLHHLRETLPLLMNHVGAEVVVVDYGCPDDSGGWVLQHHPRARVVRVGDDPGFCIARARNKALPEVRTEWICFIDADTRVVDDLAAWLSRQASPAGFYRPDPMDFETGGAVICRRADLERAGGYDELIRGYGGEDTDLYCRLIRLGVERKSFPARFLEPIRHSHEQRMRFYDNKDIDYHRLLFRLYRTCKLDIMDLQHRVLAPDELRNLLQLAQQTASIAMQNREQATQLVLTLPEHGELPLSHSYRLARKLTYVVEPIQGGPDEGEGTEKN